MASTTKHDDQDLGEQIKAPPAAPAGNGSGAIERITRDELEQLLAPHTVSLRTWLTGILSEEEFPEDDPDEMALGMLAQIMYAESSEEALAIFQLDRAKEMCGNTPGGHSPVLEILGARPLRSTYGEGAACYVIVSAVEMATGRRLQFTTGSRAVQMLLLKHIHEGWMPFRAMLEIRQQPTQRGFHPINLVAGI